MKLSVNDSVEDSAVALEGEQQDETPGSQVHAFLFFNTLKTSCIGFPNHF